METRPGWGDRSHLGSIYDLCAPWQLRPAADITANIWAMAAQHRALRVSSPLLAGPQGCHRPRGPLGAQLSRAGEWGGWPRVWEGDGAEASKSPTFFPRRSLTPPFCSLRPWEGQLPPWPQRRQTQLRWDCVHPPVTLVACAAGAWGCLWLGMGCVGGRGGAAGPSSRESNRSPLSSDPRSSGHG